MKKPVILYTAYFPESAFKGNTINFCDEEAEDIDDLNAMFEECETLNSTIAMALHGIQQQSGTLIVNGYKVEALVIDQTNGYEVDFSDIYLIDGRYRRLDEILEIDSSEDS
jgi:hypothetical protein